MGNSCGKFLQENLVGKWNRVWEANQSGYSSGKSLILQENLAGISCGKLLWEKKVYLRKGSDWWKFSIWNRVKGSQPIRIQLGKSCGKILWEILAGNSCGTRRREKGYLRKVVVGGNLAFGIG